VEDISQKIFIETGYQGVIVAAIPWSQGQILIDAPFKNEDIRSWRASLINLAAGGERVLINLDAHYDRTLGSRAMEATLIAHEATAMAFRTRPLMFKNQHLGTGADWEQTNNITTTRWSPPEITFESSLTLHPDGLTVRVEHHPGPMSGSCWVEILEEKILFVGDTLPVNQPPFLANADIPAWVRSLELLQTPRFSEYTLISSRGGNTNNKSIPMLIDWMKEVESRMVEMGAKNSPPDETAAMVDTFLKIFNFPLESQAQFYDRIRWGLFQNYARRFFPSRAESEE
jgi:glyoxylase-like metal-dependent hydrolase (beta-lactamase superfamily II)